MSSELTQVAVAVATLVVIVVGVTVAIVELRQEVLARRLQGISALFSEIWPEQMSSAAWEFLLHGKPYPEPLSSEQRELLPVLVAHYNRLGFLLHQGLVKEKEILGYPPFGILAAELFSMLKSHLDESSFMNSSLGENAIWWEYLAQRANAYWKTDGRAMMAGVDRYTTEPMVLMNDWATAMASRGSG